MKHPGRIDEAIRCLQQLSSAAPGGVSARDIALLEDLAEPSLTALLEELQAKGFVEGAGAGRYRLARPAGEIRVSEVIRALGAATTGPALPLTLEDLMRFESRVFASDAVAHAA
jgi:DNA-binding IscR family transcriptional regulator